MTKYNSATSNPTEQTQRRRDLRNNATPAEAALWRWLKSGGAGGWKFRRQHGMGRYVMDFYCPALRLCVELDGSAHDYSFDHDEERTRFLRAQGITVMRFRNEVVWTNPQGIVEEIVRFGKEVTDPTPNPVVASTRFPSSPEEGNRRGARGGGKFLPCKRPKVE